MHNMLKCVDDVTIVPNLPYIRIMVENTQHFQVFSLLYFLNNDKIPNNVSGKSR